MMLPIHLALVSEDPDLDPRDVARVSAAVQKQLTRDFAPIWGVAATIDPFPTLDDVPVDYWPVIVSNKFTFPSLGIHLAVDGQPFALVKSTDSWSLTISHEAMEAVADPAGHRLAAGQSPKAGQGRVEFLVEICDPCEHADNGYTVNGVLVSDFCTPHYFDPVSASGVRYSFTGAITGPRQVLTGGYLSWHDPVSDEWWQLRQFDDGPAQCESLGRLTSGQPSIREEIDRLTPHPQLDKGLASDDSSLQRAKDRGERAKASCAARACSLRTHIGRLQASS